MPYGAVYAIDRRLKNVSLILVAICGVQFTFCCVGTALVNCFSRKCRFIFCFTRKDFILFDCSNPISMITSSQYCWDFSNLNSEVHKFDNFIPNQCYLGTCRYFFNQPNFLRYFTDNRCCYDHPQVLYRAYRITLSIVYELKSIDYSGITSQYLWLINCGRLQIKLFSSSLNITISIEASEFDQVAAFLSGQSMAGLIASIANILTTTLSNDGTYTPTHRSGSSGLTRRIGWIIHIYLVYYEALSFFITASVIILIGFASYINLYGLCDTKQKISEYDNLDEDVNNNINSNENQVSRRVGELTIFIHNFSHCCHHQARSKK